MTDSVRRTLVQDVIKSAHPFSGLHVQFFSFMVTLKNSLIHTIPL